LETTAEEEVNGRSLPVAHWRQKQKKRLTEGVCIIKKCERHRTQKIFRPLIWTVSCDIWSIRYCKLIWTASEWIFIFL